MPIIGNVGRKSWSVRIVVWTIYATLILGAATMIYPFMLMISGSLKSEADFHRVTPIPAYFNDTDVLWQKYLESKYARVLIAEPHLGRSVESWRLVEPPTMTEADRETAEQFIAFREQFDWPFYWTMLGHTEFRTLLARNSRRYRELAQLRYDDDVSAYSDAVGVRYNTWSQVGILNTAYAYRYHTFADGASERLIDELKQNTPRYDLIIMDLDKMFWNEQLRPNWATIEEYNAAHGTNYERYDDVPLSTTPPAAGQARDDWEQYVRVYLNAAFIHLGDGATEQFRRFLREAAFAEGGIEELNLVWHTEHTSFDEIELPDPVTCSTAQRNALNDFIKNKTYCPLELLSIYGPRQAFEQYVAEQRGVPVDDVRPLPIPIAHVDYLDMLEHQSELRHEFLTRNYKAVLDYILLHGNGVRNTIIFCALMIGATLLVNPLAAYGLSRYKPPTTYTILLFCMCTMAFPAEVTMIPAFLLLKRFPLYPLAIGFAAALATGYLLHKLWPRGTELAKVMTATVVGILAGWWGAPQLGYALTGDAEWSVSLLNTFWALVLPGMANGFSIFLLKGFFDSLPRDLYEAADIDGANEWTKFWSITMSLSKPILAVIALNAFTMAYGEFMMALVIIPDQRMWTIMVWLFQLQSYSHPTVVYASLVLAAIPTLLIFMFCQNIIMRGIVVPVEK